ncbi:MAG: head-tail connector protein [Mesorhizobium sp.]|nr:head-tail connector protein [Mesorhizobium sp.]MCO5163537.1 head-tail connector protein [Mesorhizobium sp.]
MIVSVETLRQQLNLDAGIEDDTFLAGKIGAAESWIEAFIGEPLADLDPMPGAIREAILQLAAHLFSNREAVLVGVSAQPVPFGVVDLIRPWRKWEF